MSIILDKKIKTIKLVKDEQPINNKITTKIKKRPSDLIGTTYKLQSPLTEHALYITINHIEIDNVKYPFEIFINSKSLEHQQWIITLTRLISAIFRQHASYGIDVSFIISELRSVFDPNGGYQLKHRRVPSLVSEIGDIIETHLIKLGTIENHNILSVISEKQSQFRECPSCNSISLAMLDGCWTCNSCGYSKCG
jgi:ribonucleoside-diphosphate reductase alpha chain